MGCGNSKEKEENEMMKMKMERIELQMERYKQLQKLKEIDGYEIKPPEIPDYLDPKRVNNTFLKSINNSSSTMTRNNNIKRRRPIRSKSSKTFILQKKNKLFNFDEEKTTLRKGTKRITQKRKTMKI